MNGGPPEPRLVEARRLLEQRQGLAVPLVANVNVGELRQAARRRAAFRTMRLAVARQRLARGPLGFG
jgi:hypothetical protein